MPSCAAPTTSASSALLFDHPLDPPGDTGPSRWPQRAAALRRPPRLRLGESRPPAFGWVACRRRPAASGTRTTPSTRVGRSSRGSAESKLNILECLPLGGDHLEYRVTRQCFCECLSGAGDGAIHAESYSDARFVACWFHWSTSASRSINSRKCRTWARVRRCFPRRASQTQLMGRPAALASLASTTRLALRCVSRDRTEAAVALTSSSLVVVSTLPPLIRCCPVGLRVVVA